MFRKSQKNAEAKESIRPIDTLLDEAIKNCQLAEASRLLHICNAKVIHPNHLLDVIFGPYDERSNKKYNLAYRYENRLLNPPPSMIKILRFLDFNGPTTYKTSYPDKTDVLREIRGWIQFAIEADCIDAKHSVWGDTMLMWAVANKDVYSVERLLAAKADLDIRNNLGQAVMNIALLYEDKDILNLLSTEMQQRVSKERTPLRCTIL